MAMTKQGHFRKHAGKYMTGLSLGATAALGGAAGRHLWKGVRLGHASIKARKAGVRVAKRRREQSRRLDRVISGDKRGFFHQLKGLFPGASPRAPRIVPRAKHTVRSLRRRSLALHAQSKQAFSRGRRYASGAIGGTVGGMVGTTVANRKRRKHGKM